MVRAIFPEFIYFWNFLIINSHLICFKHINRACVLVLRECRQIASLRECPQIAVSWGRVLFFCLHICARPETIYHNRTQERWYLTQQTSLPLRWYLERQASLPLRWYLAQQTSLPLRWLNCLSYQ